MNNKLIAYTTLRTLIGILAMLFPLILLVGYFIGGGRKIPESLSITYWSNNRDIFTSMLIIFSVFLFTYKGYDRTDNILTNISAGAFLATALFPCKHLVLQDYLFHFIPINTSNIVHGTGAAVGFTFLGIMSLTQFTKGQYPFTDHKVYRNTIYRIDGIIILSLVGAMLIMTLVPWTVVFIGVNYPMGIWFVMAY